MSVKLFFLAILPFSILSCSKASYLNNRGVMEAYFEDFKGSKEFFLEALTLEPNYFEARYNLALADMTQEQLAQAYKELDYLEAELLKSENLKPELKAKSLFQIYFAKAFIKGLLGEIPKALDFYQKSLEIAPNSKEVKKNIELLLQGQKGESGQKQGEDESDQSGKEGEEKSDKSKKGDESKDSEGEKESDKDIKGRDDKTLKRKNLSQKEVNQILKEIKKQESEIRSKENTQFKGEGASGKTW